MGYPAWQCKKHGTFGDRGWSCAVCGYPLGAKNFELKDGKVKKLRYAINLFIGTLYIYDLISL